MIEWIGNAIGDIGSWLGSGIANLFKWLFDGVRVILVKLIDASDGLFAVLDSIWNFGAGLISGLVDLFTLFFPFVPAPVATAIGLGLTATLIIGLYKKARGN